MVRTVIAVVLLLAPATSALAGGCQQFFAHRAVVQQIVAVPTVYYAAGQNIEQDALAAKVAKIVVSQLRAEMTSPPKQQAAPQSLLSQACARCHSGPTPKGNVTIDGQTAMECHQILAAIRAVADGSMPKGITLSAEQKGRLLDGLLAMEQPADRPQSVTVQQPQESGVLK